MNGRGNNQKHQSNQGNDDSAEVDRGIRFDKSDGIGFNRMESDLICEITIKNKNQTIREGGKTNKQIIK